jgi:hypothetical protein
MSSLAVIETVLSVRRAFGHISDPTSSQIPVLGGKPVTVAEFNSPDSSVKFHARVSDTGRVLIGPVSGKDSRHTLAYKQRIVFDLRRRGINAYPDA